MDTGTMARGEYEVWKATGRRASICPLSHNQEEALIEQLRRHWHRRFEEPEVRINSRYFCYEAIRKLRYWRFHYKPNICPVLHPIEGISWDSAEAKEVCPVCWNPSHVVEYENRVELVLKSKRFSNNEKRNFLERSLARQIEECDGEPPMIAESYVLFLREKLDSFDTDFPQLQLF